MRLLTPYRFQSIRIRLRLRRLLIIIMNEPIV